MGLWLVQERRANHFPLRSWPFLQSQIECARGPFDSSTRSSSARLSHRRPAFPRIFAEFYPKRVPSDASRFFLNDSCTEARIRSRILSHDWKRIGEIQGCLRCVANFCHGKLVRSAHTIAAARPIQAAATYLFDCLTGADCRLLFWESSATGRLPVFSHWGSRERRNPLAAEPPSVSWRIVSQRIDWDRRGRYLRFNQKKRLRK